MKHRLRTALAAAHAAFDSGPQVVTVKLPLHETSDVAVRRRRAGETAITLAPVSIAAPREETAQDLRQFVLDQFTPPARRLAS